MGLDCIEFMKKEKNVEREKKWVAKFMEVLEMLEFDVIN